MSAEPSLPFVERACAMTVDVMLFAGVVGEVIAGEAVGARRIDQLRSLITKADQISRSLRCMRLGQQRPLSFVREEGGASHLIPRGDVDELKQGRR